MRLPINNSFNEYLEDDYYFNDTLINSTNTTITNNNNSDIVVFSILLCMFCFPVLICICYSFNRCCEDLCNTRSSRNVNNNYNYDSDDSYNADYDY